LFRASKHCRRRPMMGIQNWVQNLEVLEKKTRYCTLPIHDVFAVRMSSLDGLQ
jgi:hypothetical protein